MGGRGRIGAIGAAVLVAAAFGAQSALPAASAQPRQASPTESRSMTRALPAKVKLCSPRNARVSASNGHFGVVVAQEKCGAPLYHHYWLERSTLRPGAAWRVVERRSGSYARPPGCARRVGLPADIRCW